MDGRVYSCPIEGASDGRRRARPPRAKDEHGIDRAERGEDVDGRGWRERLAQQRRERRLSAPTRPPTTRSATTCFVSSAIATEAASGRTDRWVRPVSRRCRGPAHDSVGGGWRLRCSTDAWPERSDLVERLGPLPKRSVDRSRCMPARSPLTRLVDAGPAMPLVAGHAQPAGMGWHMGERSRSHSRAARLLVRRRGPA